MVGINSHINFKKRKILRKNRAEQIADIIKEQELVKGFDEELFRKVIERVTVLSIVEVEFKSRFKVKEIL